MSDVSTSTGTEHKVWEGKVACGFTRELREAEGLLPRDDEQDRLLRASAGARGRT